MKGIPGGNFFLILFSERELYRIDIFCILDHFYFNKDLIYF